jgi:4-amino-4-deoxy-L-arabinose transferase-like glycosyltransferase
MTIAAVYLPLVAVGLTLLSDPLFVVLVLAAVYAALRARGTARRPASRWAAASGALAGLAWLTRSNGYVLLLPLALLVWTSRPRVSLRSLAQPAVLVGCALLVIAPWTVRNALVLHAFVPVSDNAGYTLAGTYNAVAANDRRFRGGWRPAQQDPHNAALIAASRDELDESRRLGAAARGYARRHPGYALRVGWCNTLRLAHLAALSCGDDPEGPRRNYEGEFSLSPALAEVAIVSFWLVALLALLGTLTPGARAAPRALWLVPAVLWTVVFVIAATRLRAPLEPFLIMLAALALVDAADRVRPAPA